MTRGHVQILIVSQAELSLPVTAGLILQFTLDEPLKLLGARAAGHHAFGNAIDIVQVGLARDGGHVVTLTDFLLVLLSEVI